MSTIIIIGGTSSWSAIGSKAKDLEQSEPTMVFNFNNMSGEEIKATVIHQFGHALGLGHALMRFDDWSNLKPNVDMQAMMRICGALNEEHLEDVLTGDDVNHDMKSVMVYR